MTDRASKISELDEVSSLADTSLIVAVNEPNTANAVTVAVTKGNALKSIVSNTITTNTVLITANNTPSGNNDTVVARKFWWDDNYLYVSIANNHIKRVPLESF